MIRFIIIITNMIIIIIIIIIIILFITSRFIKMSVMTMTNTMNRNHVTPGTVTPELKVSSKSNSPIIITAVFTKERPGLENPAYKRNE